MPRVSPEHLEARRRQILEAARRCFARNGFHATSMQDVLAEAELSAGAVYRYFASKDEIIAAIAREAVAGIEALFDEGAEAAEAPPLDQVILRAFEYVERRAEQDGMGRIALQGWAEAARNPELAAMVSEAYLGARASMARLVRRHQRDGTIPAEIVPEDVAAVIVGLAPGLLLQRVIVGDVDAERYARGLAGLAAAMR